MFPLVSRAAVLHAPGDIRIEEFELRQPGEGELVLKITACGLCPGEVMDWYVARKAPVVLGHEAVGVVVAAGGGAHFKAGDRLFVHHHAPCMACRACRRGEYVHCAAWRPRRLIPGGLASYALAQSAAVASDALAIPEGLSDEAATFIEPLATVVKSLRRARLRYGDRVLVIGLGVMGLLHLLAARELAAPSLIVGADRSPMRISMARGYADLLLETSGRDLAEAVREATGGEGVDVAVVGPGTVEAMEAGRRCLAPGGTLVLFTPTPPEDLWQVSAHDLYFDEITVVPSYSAGPGDTREALRLLAGGLQVEPLVTHRLALTEAAVGYELMRAAGEALKVVVRPWSPAPGGPGPEEAVEP